MFDVDEKYRESQIKVELALQGVNKVISFIGRILTKKKGKQKN